MTPESVLAALATLAAVDDTDLSSRHHRMVRDYLDRWPDPPPDVVAAEAPRDVSTALASYQAALGALAASPDPGLTALARRCLVETQLAWPAHVVDTGLRPTFALPVHAVRPTGRDGVRLELELPLAVRERFRHSAGQHVKVVHATAGVVQHRSYSLCTGPRSVAETGRLVLGVRTLPDSFVSATLADPPAELWVSPPHGSMMWPPAPGADGRPLLLCGIGSGITPVLAIADEALRTTGGQVDLIVVDRGPEDAMLQEDVAALVATHAGRFTVHSLWTRVPGRTPLTAARIAECLAAVAPDHRTVAYVSGADTPVRLLVDGLRAHGVAEVHQESFDTSRRARVETPPRPGGTVTIDAGDGAVTVDVRPGESLLVALIGLGREPRYSCLTGTCGECEVELVAGTVAPEDSIPRPGRVRACIAAPAPLPD